MAAGFLDLIQPDLNSVAEKLEKAFKIKPGHLSKFAHLETESLQKYLHPALVLLSGKLFRYEGEKLIHLGAAVQLIYLASSVHFRIPDENERPAEDTDPRDASPLPVLVGDFLYGKYFTGLCDGDILEFLAPLAEVIAEMNFGALLRRKNSGQTMADLTLAMTVIEKEAALLTEKAACLAGILAGASDSETAGLAKLGRGLGMACGVLERNLDPALAEPYFDEALTALGSLPPGEGRTALENMVEEIRSGKIKVPVKKIGRSQEGAEQQAGDQVMAEHYKGREEYVQSIFSAIAQRYNTLNTVLSFNQDKHWRKFTVEQTGLKSGGTALDVCCGTGMITTELAKKVGPSGRVVGLDFCEDMLAIARDNLKESPFRKVIEYIQGNATELPFPDNTFDCVTIGFGLRNIPNRKRTIRELMRVVRPGGRVVCLEFSKPSVPVFKQIYNFYFDKWVPFLGKLGVGQDGPYRYLHNSWKGFPHQKDLRDEFSRQGLQEATYYELTGGVVSVHVGVKPAGIPASSVAATKD